MLEQAIAYKVKLINAAEGEVLCLHSYSMNTKKLRLLQKRDYIYSCRTGLSNSSKVMIDVEGGNMMYLPLDQLINKSKSGLMMTMLI